MAFLFGGLASVVVLVMVVIIVLAFIASKFFNIPQLEVFSKVELSELMMSIIILIAAEAFFIGSEQFVSFIINEPGKTHFDLAYDFLENAILEGVYPAISYCYSMIWHYSMINTFLLRPSDSVWTWTYKVAPGADLIVAMFNLISFGLIAVFGSLVTQVAIIGFIQGTMKSFFLPAGVLLRFFPPTRQAGVFLIVFSIAFYSIYPATFALHGAMMQTITDINEGPGTTYELFPDLLSPKQIGYFALSAGAPFYAGIAGKGLDVLLSQVHIPVLSASVGLVASELFISTLQPWTMVPVLDRLAHLSLVTFFLPAFSLVITLAFINGVTNFLIKKV